MAPIDLNAIRAFVSVHETGSFSIAGSRLGVPRSTVSRSVASLEETLGAVLFHRPAPRRASRRDLLIEQLRRSPLASGK